MKKSSPILTVVLFLTVVLLLTTSFSASSQTLAKLKAFTMTISGTSTLHDWESKVLKANWNGLITIDEGGDINIQKSELKIMVKDIQSDHGRIMDNKTYEAFHSDRYPNISFSMKSFTQQADRISLEGILTMNGNSRLITLHVDAKILGNSDIQFAGSHALKMTDYKMEPPTAMMGTIKVGNEITVKFDLTIGK